MAAQIRTAPALGVTLRRERRRQGLRQADLARLAGVRQATVSKLETEGEVTTATLMAVLAALGLELRVVPRGEDARELDELF